MMELKFALILFLLLVSALKFGLCGCRYRNPIWTKEEEGGGEAVKTAPRVTQLLDGVYMAAAVDESLTDEDDRSRYKEQILSQFCSEIFPTCAFHTGEPILITPEG